MKQKGEQWRDSQGAFVAKKYVNKESRAFEDLGQKMAAEALELEKKINTSRSKLIALVEKAYQASNAKPEGKFTFYTFDRQFRFEYDIKEKWVRGYRATCDNPKAKDYAPIVHNLNHNIKVEKPVVKKLQGVTTVEDLNPENAAEAKKIWDESEPQNESGQGIIAELEKAAAAGELDFKAPGETDVIPTPTDEQEEKYIQQEALSTDRPITDSTAELGNSPHDTEI